MERWQRAFAENDKDFKELFGVKKEIFLQMHDILTAAALERRKKGGRRPVLSVGDQLFLTLHYWREYRTMKHLAFDVISQAYERTSVIVTTNLPFEQWPEVLGSARLTGAVLDRLTHRCHILEASGESYRLRAARKKIAQSREKYERTQADTNSTPMDGVSEQVYSTMSKKLPRYSLPLTFRHRTSSSSRPSHCPSRTTTRLCLSVHSTMD